MTHDCARFLDGLDDGLELDPGDCASCARELAAAQRLRSLVAALPREIEPRDHWPAIERRLARKRFPVPLALAALLAVSIVGARLLVHPPAPVSAEREWEAGIATANATFREALAASPDLDPEVRAVIEKNLSDIDRAIAEIERALEQHPSSPMLRKALVAMEQQRLDVLRQLTLSSKPG